MTVLDAHVHVWDPARLDYAWLAGLGALDAPFLPDDYRAAGGADRVVFVEADSGPDHALAEARWVAALGWPELAGIVAAADLRSPELESHLDALALTAGSSAAAAGTATSAAAGPARGARVVGIRHSLQHEAAAGFADPALTRGLALLAERGLTFDACVRHPQLDALADLLATVPHLRVVVDHAGKPPVAEGIAGDAARRWAAAMRRLAALPLVHVKLSGLPAETDAAPHAAHADDFLRSALAAFGPERSMLGSDWPVSARLGAAVEPGTWFERVRAATGLAGPEWECVAALTGERFYGFASID